MLWPFQYAETKTLVERVNIFPILLNSSSKCQWVYIFFNFDLSLFLNRGLKDPIFTNSENEFLTRSLLIILI